MKSLNFTPSQNPRTEEAEQEKEQDCISPSTVVL